jgi:hypothetical protein
MKFDILSILVNWVEENRFIEIDKDNGYFT